jgi:hypothetical protein
VRAGTSFESGLGEFAPTYNGLAQDFRRVLKLVSGVGFCGGLLKKTRFLYALFMLGGPRWTSALVDFRLEALLTLWSQAISP